jgi:GAF domain
MLQTSSMPQTRMKRVAFGLESDATSGGFEHMRASLGGPVEQICSAMSASGAVVAVRDAEGIRCVASAGDAPAVGSRLQPDSTFTRECIETGEVALCEDTEKDSRIQPAIARSLNLRSAVAVPIKVQGAVIGVIEVFSSLPSDIYTADVAVLKQCANLFAHIIVPGSSQPVERSAGLLSPHPEAASLAGEQQDTHGFSAEQRVPCERKVDSLESPVTLESACSAVRSRFLRQKENAAAGKGRLKGDVAHVFLRIAGKTTAAQRWRSRAASLSLFTLSFFSSLFFASPGALHSSSANPMPSNAAPPPVLGNTRFDEAGKGGKGAQSGKTARRHGFNGSDPTSRRGVFPSKREDKPGIPDPL